MKSKMKGVSRIDQPSTRTAGWFVRIGYTWKRVKGKKVYRAKHVGYFGDKTHGGKRKAMIEAERFARRAAK